MSYLYLCFSAFISATLFPMGSEALFVYDLSINLNVYALLFFATIGNVLGAGVNYWFGLKGEEYLVQKKVIKEQQIQIGKKLFDKYGGFALLFSWVPFVGDLIPFIAGILKYNLKLFILLSIISKGGRYIVLALIYFKFF